MKFKFIAILTLVVFVGCRTENNKNLEKEASTNNQLLSKFTSDISSYLKASNSKDWETVTNMVYPKLYDYVSKEQLIKVFQQVEEMGMKIKCVFIKIDKISKVINHDNSKYCRVYYEGDMSVKLSGTMLMNKEQLEQGFIAYYGKENVEFNEANKEFNVKAKKSMFAISDKDSDNWKYIEYNVQQEALLKKLIPKPVLNQTGN